MLPHEAEVIAEIARKYRVQLDAMTDLHNAAVAMMAAGSWTIGKPGLNGPVIQTMMGLLTKACKTFRSIQILCERGLHDDAGALTRVLLETTVAVMFILQKKPKERTLMFHAHEMEQSVKLLDEWTRTPGLKRLASKQMLQRAKQSLATYMAKLPAGTNVRRHWSGKGDGLQGAMRELKGGAVMYSSGYRHLSAISHVSDFGGHFEVDPATGEFVWEIEPTVRGFEAPSYTARQLLWLAANRIDERLGLGFAATLAPFKLTRADVKEGLQ